MPALVLEVRLLEVVAAASGAVAAVVDGTRAAAVPVQPVAAGDEAAMMVTAVAAVVTTILMAAVVVVTSRSVKWHLATRAHRGTQAVCLWVNPKLALCIHVAGSAAAGATMLVVVMCRVN